jgi:hypothetical protein
MAEVKSGINKVGNSYYQSITKDSANGSVSTTFFRVDPKGNNPVQIYDVNTPAGSTSLVKSFAANATAEEQKLLSDPNSQLSQIRSQQVTSSNPYGSNPTAVQQQAISAAAGKSGNSAATAETDLATASQQVQESIERTQGDLGGGGPLVYPVNRQQNGGDFLHIEMRTYQKSGFQSAPGSLTVTRMEDRKHTRLADVYLPIQSGIVDAISVDWGNGELNPITAQFANIAMGTMVEAGKGDLGKAAAKAGELSMDAAQLLLGSANSDMQKLLTNYFTEKAVGTPGLISRSIGGAINNNLELLFNGPTLRSFTFNFKLTPREKAEADVIKKIIRLFKRGMSPALSKSGLFLSAPNVFKIKYIYTGKGDKNEPHPYLNRIKVAALRDFSVNYTPDGNFMTYADGGSMTQYDLSMTFGEIDPVYADDYDDEQGKTGMGW